MAEEFNTQLFQVSNKLLKLLNVPFNGFKLREKIENDAYYPSMYTLSKVFNKYKVDNRGLKIEENQLDTLPLPFLAFVNVEETNAEDFVCVTKIDDKKIVYYYDKEYTISREKFIENWSSKTIFLVEATTSSIEEDYDENKKVAKKNSLMKYLLITGYVLFLSFFVFNFLVTSTKILESIFVILSSFFGLFISVLLLIHEMDASNAFLKNICSGGTKTNCNAVLNSKGAKLFGVISWGEIGFFYFSFLSLYLLVPGFPIKDKVPYLTYLIILSGLYTPYSLYYQYKVVKQWCPLCLLIQLVIVLNIFWVMFFGDYAISFTLSSMAFLVLCITIPVLLWYTVKPIIIKANEAQKNGAAYKRLVSRADIFELTLKGRPETPKGWEGLGIVKGNPNADNIILKICNTSCGHCGDAHEIFNQILKVNNNLKVITLYSISSDGSDSRQQPVSHFLALAEEEDKTRIAEAMDYWYLNDNRTYEELIEKFPISEEVLFKHVDKIDKMREWCKKTKLEYTPAIYINGKQLPITFDIDDLKDIYG